MKNSSDTRNICIRRFKKGDEKIIRDIIYRNFDEINSRDYPKAKLDQIKLEFTEEAILRKSCERTMFVAVSDDQVVGTASLGRFGDEHYALTVFINPDHHKSGIGTQLMKQVEDEAKKNKAEFIRVPAGITAENFYKKLGYEYVDGKRELDMDSHIKMIKKLN